ncbi:transcriptional regulator, TetR family [Streptoalloteichus tenebrarius]|uniref:Transcriptional regulator, TetR family n=1 Tax=Streptoalloteichus tenebrarius (strain ATCC 17920 / DSM 40477 / JCM 4838 / CBS 697.72 / NBRC 16177 / NCIMB 11028 / NRRL B-12390 / A12253. 1 / ISP 5477) TaxID=1933 RepID=A0ABT1HYM8_STRSD|nr:TetR/AcrR family transcriptional regulator C-terminal domain-containing protein [Streptoalloteichus tenebrarius]MCP2260639.1 transcriptional regulator, TetR family [Streptoalloteichus tenebrarius]BFF01523.1 TetR/AcrR family transcriptional regulator C-terminal domain-containing protein [Streptoalloteichus tenebrarius]
MRLRRETVVRAALKLVNEVGLEGLTLRLIADELGVRPPALYWHVRNKQELLDEMASLLLADAFTCIQPPRPGQTWRDWLGEFARDLRRVLLSHRDGARMCAGTYLRERSLFDATELMLRVLIDAGFPLDEATRGVATLYDFVLGFTIEEQAVTPAPGEHNERYAPEYLRAQFDPERHPLLIAAVEDAFGVEHTEARFEHGLRIVLNGLCRELEGR